MTIAMCISAVALIAATTAALLFGYLRFAQAAERAESRDQVAGSGAEDHALAA